MVKVRNGIVKVIEDIVSPIQCCKSNLATFKTNVAITLLKTLQEQIHRSSAITPSSSSYDNILRPRGALSKRHRYSETFLPQEHRVRFYRTTGIMHLATYSDVINCIKSNFCSISTKSATFFFSSSAITILTLIIIQFTLLLYLALSIS